MSIIEHPSDDRYALEVIGYIISNNGTIKINARLIDITYPLVLRVVGTTTIEMLVKDYDELRNFGDTLYAPDKGLAAR